MSSGRGNLRGAEAMDQGDDEIAQGGEDLRGMASAQAVAIFAKVDIAHKMETILNVSSTWHTRRGLSRIRHYLHAHGYELLRPVLTVASPDPDYASKRARLEELQRQAERGEIDLYYEDEIDLALLPTITHCWCKRGHQRKIETPRKNQKRYGAGLIHWVSGKLYWATSEHKDNALFRAVLSQVLEPSEGDSRRKVYVVIDNYRIHFAKPVLALLAAHSDQIELVTLPTYSPQLNPVERFWKHLRRKVTHNAFFQTINRLLDAVTEFFQDLAVRPDIVRSVAGLAA